MQKDWFSDDMHSNAKRYRAWGEAIIDTEKTLRQADRGSVWNPRGPTTWTAEAGS